MKKLFVFMIFLLFLDGFCEPSLDVNINYDPAGYRVKETVCGWVPDLARGYVADDNGCYTAVYISAQPTDKFSFTPISGPVPQAVKAAFYIAFYGNPPKDPKMLKCDIISGLRTIGKGNTVFADNTFQGVAILDKGQNIKLYSGERRSYTYVYVLIIIIVISAIFAAVRRKK